MLMKECLTKEVEAKLKNTVCSCGFTLAKCINSGVENPDGSLGAYAGCAECYTTFAPLFNPIVEKYHKFSFDNAHQANLDISSLSGLEVLKDFIVSTRIRVGRNLDGFVFGAAASKEDRVEIERVVSSALKNFKGDLAGDYYPLLGMNEDDRVKLVEDHFLFKSGDRFQEAAGLNRDWPYGRGIFHSVDKKFLVWLNEEDELRIISMQMGGDIIAVFDRLVRALNEIEQTVKFAKSEKLGYLTSCPSNLGTAMRASVHIKLEKLSQTKNFKKICSDMALSVRGIHGEFSDSAGGVYDISNKQRLGMSEVDIVKLFYNGVKELIRMEKELW